MEPAREKYKGHRIELRAREGHQLHAHQGEQEQGLELVIDDDPVPFGRLPDGRYFLEEYAYDWSDNLIALARRFVDYRE